MRLGLAGLSMSGKSTVLAAAAAWAGGTPSKTAGGATVAVARIADPRVDWLAEQVHPRKITHATLELQELPDLAPSRLEMAHKLDAVAFVVRAFDPEQTSVPHPEGRVDPAADFERLWQDWILLDWTLVENRLDRLKGAASVPKAQRRDVEREVAVLERCRKALESGVALSGAGLSPEERALLQGYSLVTFKPAIVAVNVDDVQAQSGEFPMKEKVEQAARARHAGLVTVAGKLELELGQLDPESRRAFMEEMGVQGPAGVERLSQAAYGMLGLISFLTSGEDEVRAWTITGGTPAREAAGKIHSDIARGFIRAEVVAFDDLKRLGSMARVREAGLLRLEGKDYLVKDGDVIEFRFNV